MNHPTYTLCPACGDGRVTAVELRGPDKCVLVNCDCGQAFAVHLRVSVALRTVPVPRPVWDALPLPVALPELSVESQSA